MIVGMNRMLSRLARAPSISLARLAITSLTFMLVCVPDPVCQTRKGKFAVETPDFDFAGGGGDRGA